MQKIQTKKTKKIKIRNGEDGYLNGEMKDSRKSRLFFEKKGDLLTKTKLEGLRKTIFLDRYSLKNEKGEALEEYPEQMWTRVAKGIAQFERNKTLRKEWASKFYTAMEGFKFVPGGRILSGAGTGYEVTFFNCYVIPSPEDSRGGIMESITHTVEIQARGGGVGLNLSSLRPRGARVKKVNGTSSGPVNWASLYSTANHDVIQQGGSRRGALMLMLHDWHPDIEEFIKVKRDLTKIPGANLSVCVSDSFMKAVKKDSDWDLSFPDISDPEYDDKWNGEIADWKSLGKKIIVYKTIKAREIWSMITKAAWGSAEPGLHFLERSNKRSNTWYFEKLIATNPCGEQPLGAWSVCNLGAMNLSAYVKKQEFDYKSLSKDVKIAMRFLDNVVDANFYFYKDNKLEQEKIRRTGLGTLGLGDALIKMKVKYGGEKSLEIIEKIYKVIRDSAYKASSDLAKEKGNFPAFDKDNYLKGYFIKKLPKGIKDKIKKQGIRNAVILTQAPTGTTSLLSGVSSGIEPNYDFEFKRTDRTGEHMIYHPIYKKWKDENPDKRAPDYFVTSMDLLPGDHVKVQALIQKFTDSSISKTVNAPKNYTVEDVDKLYTTAYELGCKGITLFRDGSRKGVLESTSSQKTKENIDSHEPLLIRPLVVNGSTYRLNTPIGSAFITINQNQDGDPLEVFINVGKAGSDVTAMAEALGRTISIALRLRGNMNAKERAREIAGQLEGIGGRRSVGFGSNKILSLPDAVAFALSTHLGLRKNNDHSKKNGYANGKTYVNGEGNGSVRNFPTSDSSGAVMKGNASTMVAKAPTTVSAEFVENGKVYQTAKEEPIKVGDICPSCGAGAFVYEEGCSKCHACGHSEC